MAKIISINNHESENETMYKATLNNGFDANRTGPLEAVHNNGIFELWQPILRDKLDQKNIEDLLSGK